MASKDHCVELKQSPFSNPTIAVQKVEKLQLQLHMLGGPRQSKHTVFVEDEAAVRHFSAAEHFDAPEEVLERAFNRPRKEQLLENGAAPLSHDPKQEARINRCACCILHCRAGRISHCSLLRLLKQTLYSPTCWLNFSPALHVELYLNTLFAAIPIDPQKIRRRVMTWRYYSAVCYRAKAAAYKELAERTARHEKLHLLALHMSRQKELMVGFSAFGSTTQQR